MKFSEESDGNKGLGVWEEVGEKLTFQGGGMKSESGHPAGFFFSIDHKWRLVLS